MSPDMPDDWCPQVLMAYDERGLLIECRHGDLSIGHIVKRDAPLSELPAYFRAMKQSIWIALHSERAA
jgi:hypothetical protein